jgi:HEPN domain-containing protein
LALEKVLKAIFIKVNDRYPLPIHDLNKLAEKSKITVSGEEKLLLGEITTFNIEARYDVVKTRLYRKATLAFTAKFLKATRQLFRKFRDLL